MSFGPAHLTGSDQESFRAIFESSFPREEREGTVSLLEGVRSGLRPCFIARADGVLVGFAVFSILRQANVVYLKYLATHETRRGQHIGSRLLNALVAHLRGNAASMQGLVFEVESVEHASGAERELRTRRVAFYERNGAAVVRMAPCYEAPNLIARGTIPYTLMWVPLADTAPINGVRLRACVTALMVEGYGLDPSSALVQRNLTQLLD